MYSEDAVNDHMLLRYGYVEDLFTCFSLLTYKGIELPALIIASFYYYMMKTVDKQLHAPEFLKQKRAELTIHEMKEFATRLQRLPSPEERYDRDLQRNMILICGQFIDMALQVFQDRDVLVLVTNLHDEQAIQGKNLPPHFRLFSFQQELVKAIERFGYDHDLYTRCTNLVKQHHDHPLFGRDNFDQWLYAQCREAVCLIDVADHVLHEYPVRIMLDHSNLVYPGNVFSLLGRKYTLPFLYVQNYLIDDINIIPSYASRYCVWGVHTKRWMIGKGIAPRQIDTIGSLRLEKVKEKGTKTKQELLNDLGIDSDVRVLTYATSPFTEETNRKIIYWLVTAMAKLPIVLVIKPHQDDFMDYQNWTNKHIHIIPSQYSLHQLLNASDFVTTIVSTAGIEAALFHKPLIVMQPTIPYHFNLHHNEYTQHLAKAKAGITVHSAIELRKSLVSLLADENYREKVVLEGQKFLHSTLQLQGVPPSRKLHQIVKKCMGRNWSISQGEA